MLTAAIAAGKNITATMPTPTTIQITVCDTGHRWELSHAPMSSDPVTLTGTKTVVSSSVINVKEATPMDSDRHAASASDTLPLAKRSTDKADDLTSKIALQLACGPLSFDTIVRLCGGPSMQGEIREALRYISSVVNQTQHQLNPKGYLAVNMASVSAEKRREIARCAFPLMYGTPELELFTPYLSTHEVIQLRAHAAIHEMEVQQGFSSKKVAGKRARADDGDDEEENAPANGETAEGAATTQATTTSSYKTIRQILAIDWDAAELIGGETTINMDGSPVILPKQPPLVGENELRLLDRLEDARRMHYAAPMPESPIKNLEDLTSANQHYTVIVDAIQHAGGRLEKYGKTVSACRMWIHENGKEHQREF